MSILDERAKAEVRREAHDNISKIAALVRKQIAHTLGMSWQGGKWLGPSVTLPTPDTATFAPAAPAISGVPGVVYPDGTTIYQTPAGRIMVNPAGLPVGGGGGIIAITYPSSGAIGISPTLTITWTSIPSAIDYELQVSLSPTFVSTVIDIHASTPSYTVPGTVLALSTLYYARVRCTTNEMTTGNTVTDPTTGDVLVDSATGDVVSLTSP